MRKIIFAVTLLLPFVGCQVDKSQQEAAALANGSAVAKTKFRDAFIDRTNKSNQNLLLEQIDAGTEYQIKNGDGQSLFQLKRKGWWSNGYTWTISKYSGGNPSCVFMLYDFISDQKAQYLNCSEQEAAPNIPFYFDLANNQITIDYLPKTQAAQVARDPKLRVPGADLSHDPAAEIFYFDVEASGGVGTISLHGRKFRSYPINAKDELCQASTPIASGIKIEIGVESKGGGRFKSLPFSLQGLNFNCDKNNSLYETFDDHAFLAFIGIAIDRLK